MFQLSPSILAADFWKLGEQIQEVEEAGAQWLHVDVMDGAFVPSISFGMPVLQSIRSKTSLFLDVHLMVKEPERYIEDFVKCGADLLTVHLETCKNVRETIKKIKQAGCKVGISVNPDTSVEQVFPYAGVVDLILIMSVYPGFGGQKFIPETLERVQTVRKKLDKDNLSCHVEVDGGIYPENVGEVLKAGADVIVAGTAVFGGSVKENIKEFYAIAKGLEENQ